MKQKKSRLSGIIIGVLLLTVGIESTLVYLQHEAIKVLEVKLAIAMDPKVLDQKLIAFRDQLEVIKQNAIKEIVKEKGQS